MTSAAFDPDSIDTFIAQQLPPWLVAGDKSERLIALHAALVRQEEASRRLGALIDAIPAPHDFAEPLLHAALAQRGVAGVDLRRGTLHLFQRVQAPTAAPNLPRREIERRTSRRLLAAALHNFHVSETRPSMLLKGELRHANGSKIPMGFNAFAGLCRSVDVGRQYQALLESRLRPLDPPGHAPGQSARAVEQLFEDSQQAHFEVAMRIAALKGILDEQTFLRLLPLFPGKSRVPALPGQIDARQLYLLGKCIRGVVTLEVRADAEAAVQGVIAWVPGDPQQAVSHFTSWQALYSALGQRLRDADYRKFFYRFLTERDRVGFAQALLEQVANPASQVELDGRNLAIATPLRPHLRALQIEKMFDDARVLAVPTGDEDAEDRHQRLEAYTELGYGLLGLAALFVPVLGEVLLAVTAVQVADEVYQGYESWKIGDRKQALEHVFNVAQTVLVNALIAKASSAGIQVFERFAAVDELTPVRLPSGAVRLTRASIQPQYAEGDGLLIRRFGASLADVSDTTAAQLMETTGLQPDTLRRLLAEEAQAPSRLVDAHALHQAHEQQPELRGAALDAMLRERWAVPLSEEALLMRQFPMLSQRGAREVLEQTSSTEQQRLMDTRRIPLSVMERVRWQLRESRIDRACAGLRLDRAANADTEQLALGLIEKLAPWPEAMRIEVREGSQSGELRASWGAAQAGDVALIVRQPAGYAVQAGGGDAGTLLGSFMQCMSAPQLLTLASAALDEQALGERLARLARLDRGQAADLIGLVPIGRGWRPPRRFGDGRLGYPLSGRPESSRQAIRRGIHQIFPTLDDEQMQAYLLDRMNRRVELWQHYAELRDQLGHLRSALDDWRGSWLHPRDALRRQRVANEFRRSWRRKITNEGGEYVLFVEGERVGSLPTLPQGISYGHVVRLALRDMELTDIDSDFLSRFPNLVELDLTGNRLAWIPQGVERLTQLRQLRLAHNQIELNNAGNQRLAALRGLRMLNLSHNPLGQAPDLSRLINLTHVSLRATGLRELPSRLPEWAVLDLRGNQIRQVREDLASLRGRIATLSLHDNPLDPASAALLDEAAGGVEAGQRGSVAYRHQPVGTQLRDIWMGQESTPQRVQTWQRLREEPGSHGLFQFLADFAAQGDFKKSPIHYRRRIWDILEYCEQHQSMRARLFEEASGPRTCADQLLLILDQIEVSLAAERPLDQVPRDRLDRAIWNHGRGLWRLDQVDQLAREHEQLLLQRGRHIVDPVEVMLFFRVNLARELELPVLTRKMHYAVHAHVTRGDLQSARAQVLAAETDEALMVSLSERPFWKREALRIAPGRFDEVNEPFYKRLDQLSEDAAAERINEETLRTQSTALSAEFEAAQQALLLPLARELHRRLHP
ncbi:NEL-type E3 ubiquitin ligase domain-containing protein [Pseudomonas sp. NPDC090233]|uniref:NEL-type E3 ubiquitin ligase domain-containing protein n=1 Tax=Pseudomonas sp. NPDC090233 TaxID=3364479 RepID=UPI003839F87E